MDPPRGWDFRALCVAARAHESLLRGAQRVLLGSRRFTGAVLAGCTTDAERAALTIALYDRGPHSGPRKHGLFAWEERWFSQHLPRPPAWLLVGAAGAGREVAWLLARGYQVDAFEPAARPLARCVKRAHRAGRPGLLLTGMYQDLADAVLEGRDTPLRALARRRYDAVLLGWGSLSHLLATEDRRRLLRACHQLCPRGRILASFWTRSLARGAGFGGDAPGRAELAGRHLARALCRLRRVDPGGGVEWPLFVPGHGFVHAFSRDEVRQLAQALGRRAVWPPDQRYPHVTLVPGA